MSYLLYYMLAINLITFISFGLDKRSAVRGQWRISERNLLILSALGGSPGGFFGQQLFRHKTKKMPFVALFWMIIILQIIILGYAIDAYPQLGGTYV